ncbi:MAG: cytochrome c maturation protein CcmE [Longimicrobiales bacterium]|nr:cytochrome c maturation protein CcmE [Longimicrobiales bacterium]
MGSNRRFMIGLVGVAAVVTWLVWTGVSDTMTYFLTPSEYVERLDADPSFRQVGVRIGAVLVPESYEQGAGELEHHFLVHDADDPSVTFPVRYVGVLPDTFNDAPDMVTETVIEGRFDEDGVFDATVLLTKCGSRYEADPEQLRAMNEREHPAG